MTYWATLWYAGAVVMTIGYEGQTLQLCQEVSNIIMNDINSAYEENYPEIKDSPFNDNKFYTTCEDKVLPIDEKFKNW